MKCDVIAEGVVAAAKELGLQGAARRAPRGDERGARAEDPGRERARDRGGDDDGATAAQKVVAAIGGAARAARSVSHEHPRRQGTQGRLSRASRASAGSFHAKQMHRVRHERRRRRHARREAARSSRARSRSSTPSSGAVKDDGRRHELHLRPAARRGRRDPRGLRRRHARSSSASPRASPSWTWSRCAASSRAARNARLVGPNCPGIITPGACKIGIMPGHIHKAGPHRRRLALRARSRTRRSGSSRRCGIGQSTCIGIGGDPVGGMDFVDVLELFQADPDTHGVIMIGEIGGGAEERAARLHPGEDEQAGRRASSPARTAPAGKRMGHAGAIIAGGKGTAAEKIEALEAAGIKVAPTPGEMGSTLKSLLGYARRPLPAPIVQRASTAEISRKERTERKERKDLRLLLCALCVSLRSLREIRGYSGRCGRPGWTAVSGGQRLTRAGSPARLRGASQAHDWLPCRLLALTYFPGRWSRLLPVWSIAGTLRRSRWKVVI